MAYLDRMHFRDYKVHQFTSILKQNEAEHHFFNCKGKGVNCWSVPLFQKAQGDFDTPDVGEDNELF